MKWNTIALPALALCLILSGCRGGVAPEASQTPPPATATPSQGYTEKSAYAAFDAWNDSQGVTGQTATSCALAEDRFGGLAAVVTYTDENNNTECNLSYIYQDGTCSPIGVVSNESDTERDFVLENGGGLTYLGEGKATILAREVKTGNLYRYTVECGSEGPSSEFTVNTDAVARESE